MLNNDYRLTPVDDSACMVSWRSLSPAAASWLFVNGRHAAGPIVSGTMDRSVRINLARAQVAALELHDFADAGIVPQPIIIEPNTRPMLIWRAVEDAGRYRIYHRVFGEPTEKVIFDQPARDGLERYEIACPVRLDGCGGVWHFLHVEAVDVYGNESTREAWAYFVMDLPATIPAINVTAGSAAGLYNFILED